MHYNVFVQSKDRENDGVQIRFYLKMNEATFELIINFKCFGDLKMLPQISDQSKCFYTDLKNIL